jgi:D-alanine-D-alanine ligase
MKLVKASGIAGRKQTRQIDIVFPAMHGTYGEDGALMGLLDMAGIPYVGCGLSAAAVAMDKVLSKEIAKANSLSITNFLTFTKAEIESEPLKAIKAITKTLSYPIFVKPAHLGSSIGISQVKDETELRNGLEVASHYDDKIIVEEAVSNLIEVTLPIMGNDRLTPALLERPLTSAEDFFDFDTKYIRGGKKGGGKPGIKGSQGYSQIPAKLPKDLYDKAETLALDVYKSLGCSGTARVDLLIDEKTKVVYFNEVNPLPGSLYAHNWNLAGVSGVELVQKLVDLAKERYDLRKSLNTSFNTNFLQQF